MNGLNSRVKLRPGGCPPGHLHCSAAQEEGDGPRERVTEGSVRTVTRIGRAEGGGAGTVSALGRELAEARPSPRLRGQASTRCPEPVSLHWPSRREARLDSLLTQGTLGFVLDRFPPNYLRATPTPFITQFFFFLNGTLTYI